jgi:hypothetical protein
LKQTDDYALATERPARLIIRSECTGARGEVWGVIKSNGGERWTFEAHSKTMRRTRIPPQD